MEHRNAPLGATAAARLARRAAALAAGAVVLAACGGGETRDDHGIPVLRVVVEPAEVVVRQTQSVTVRVDTPNVGERDLPSGFAFDLDEVAGRIDVQVAPCPQDTGSLACRLWTIKPGADSVPGEYQVGVQTVGSRLGTGQQTFAMTVLAAQPPAYGAAVAVSATDDSVLVINDRDQVYARGFNNYAQVRFGYLRSPFPGAGYRPLVEPHRVNEFVAAPLPAGERWLNVAAGAAAFAVRNGGAGAGAVFAWGLNGDLGFAPHPLLNFQAPAREVPGVVNAVAVSDNNGYRTAALLADGRVLQWDYAPGEHRIVCERVDSTRCETLADVVAVAGSGISGLVLRADGSVWHFVDAPDEVVRVAGLVAPVGAIVAAPPIAVIVAGRTEVAYHNAALGRDGTVRTWKRPNPRAAVAPSQVPGLDNVVAVSVFARGSGLEQAAYAAAIRSDGTVWQWAFEDPQPRQVAGLTNPLRIADGHVITGECAVGGSLWRLEADGRAVRLPGFGEGPGCPPVETVDVDIVVTGQGSVLSTPAAIDCGAACRAPFARHTELRLHAVPAPGWHLSAWRGDGCGPDVAPASALRCEAVFTPGGDRRLSVRTSGAGSVTSQPPGIDCGEDCAEIFPVGFTITLRATPAPGFRFAAFGGDNGCAGGAVTLHDATTCIAQFDALPAPPAPTGFAASAVPNAVQLRWDSGDNAVIRYKLERAGPSGVFETLDSSVPGTSTERLDGSVAPSTAYTYRLTAINLGGASAPVTASATTLAAARATLTVTVAGNGTVTSTPSGISCTAAPGGNCSATFATGTQVRLAATPGAGSQFSAFGGDADCADGVVTLTSPLACSVTFAPIAGQGWVQLGGAPLTRSGVVPVASVALDAGQVPHVAFVEAVPAGDVARLRVRRFDGTAWQPLGGALNAGSITAASDPSLGLSPAGVLHVAWSQGNGIQQNVFVARFAGTAWEAVGAPGVPLNYVAGSRAIGPSLAFDAGGAPIVAWIENDTVKFKRWTGVAWVPAQGAGSAEGPPSSGADRVHLSTRPAGVPVLAWTEGSGAARALRVVRAFDFTPLGAQVNAPLAAGTTLTDFGVLGGIPDAIATMVWVERTPAAFTVRASRWDGQWIPFSVAVAAPDSFVSLALSREERAFALSAASSDADLAWLQVGVRTGSIAFDAFGTPLASPKSGALRTLALAMAGAGRPVVAGSRAGPGDLHELHVYGYFP